MKNKPIIVYLHGFRSSPQSYKAQLVTQHMQSLGLADQYLCPQLPASPDHAIALVQTLIKDTDPARVTLIGSSLGGYYATWLAEQTGYRTVLLNPMVRIPTDMSPFMNAATSFHSDEPFEFKPEYIDQLRRLEVANITQPERYYLIAATGDELLDWREMQAHYPDARQTIIEGSDHGLTGFEQHIDSVLAFAGL